MLFFVKYINKLKIVMFLTVLGNYNGIVSLLSDIQYNEESLRLVQTVVQCGFVASLALSIKLFHNIDS